MLEEMQALNAAYGVTRFDLIHDMFTVDRRKVVAFCEAMIEAGSCFEWSCSAAAPTVSILSCSVSCERLGAMTSSSELKPALNACSK